MYMYIYVNKPSNPNPKPKPLTHYIQPSFETLSTKSSIKPKP